MKTSNTSTKTNYSKVFVPEFSHHKKLVAFINKWTKHAKKSKYNAMRVIAALASYWNVETKTCYPTQKTLAAKVGLCESRVKKILRSLRQLGVINVVQSGKVRKRNFYSFNFLNLVLWLKDSCKPKSKKVPHTKRENVPPKNNFVINTININTSIDDEMDEAVQYCDQVQEKREKAIAMRVMDYMRSFMPKKSSRKLEVDQYDLLLKRATAWFDALSDDQKLEIRAKKNELGLPLTEVYSLMTNDFSYEQIVYGQ